mgnify:CR=1 FL=1
MPGEKWAYWVLLTTVWAGYDDENYRIKSGTEEYCYDRQNKNLLVRYAKDGSIEKYVYGNGLISSEKTGVTVENSNTADAKTDSTKTETAGTLTVYHCDLRGSVRAVTDQTGTVTDRYSYSLYGERTHDTGDGDHIFGYCGRDGVITERDGLLYMRARYYSPELRRFISADSVIGNLASTPSLNRYAYANGNPVTQIDPFGLSAEPGTKKAKKNINWREAVHDALDIAGSITGYGDICDAVNAVLYLTEGDYINAGLSALSIIPGADAFTKTGKASKVLGNGIVESGLKHLDNVADGIKKLVKKADDAIDLEKHLPKKLLKEEAEAFAKKADKVADDVVEDAAKAIKSGTATINPNDIRFSQSSVNGASEIIDSMKAKGWDGDPIDVVRMPDGNLTTIDNTRVLAARYAEIDVQANVHAFDEVLPQDLDLIERLTTPKGVPQTWGDAVLLRIGKQNSGYRNTYPLGSNIIGWSGN